MPYIWLKSVAVCLLYHSLFDRHIPLSSLQAALPFAHIRKRCYEADRSHQLTFPANHMTECMESIFAADCLIRKDNFSPSLQNHHNRRYQEILLSGCFQNNSDIA